MQTRLFLLTGLILTACSRTPDSVSTQPVSINAASVTAVVTPKIDMPLPGKMLNQKMVWPDLLDLLCVPAPAYYNRATTRSFEAIRRSFDTLVWETIGRYPKGATATPIHHIATFKIAHSAVGDLELERDDSPRASYINSSIVNFPLAASAIKDFSLVSYFNESGKQEAHFTFEVTLESNDGGNKNATYNCVSYDYETVEDSNARQAAEAVQERRAKQMEILSRMRSGGKCDAIASEMAAAIDSRNDVQFAYRNNAALYYGCVQ